MIWSTRPAGAFRITALETFSEAGIMSAGLSGGAETEPMATLAASAARANELADLLWIACGKEAALEGAKSRHQALERAGIGHTYLETDGAHHWRVRRRDRRDLAPLLFKLMSSGMEERWAG
jgi:hypothetical protein